MICKECQAKNITKANFCQSCGAAFTDADRKAAYDKTLFGWIKKAKKLKSYATLSFITGHPLFKTAILLLILIWGFFLGRTHGNAMTILEADSYRVQQNTNTGDYYILTEENQVPLNLYIPKKAESLHLQTVEEEAVVSELDFTAEDSILLESSDEAYYVITADYGKQTENITVYVLLDVHYENN